MTEAEETKFFNDARKQHLIKMVVNAQKKGIIDGWRAYLMAEFKSLGLSDVQIGQAIKEASE